MVPFPIPSEWAPITPFKKKIILRNTVSNAIIEWKLYNRHYAFAQCDEKSKVLILSLLRHWKEPHTAGKRCERSASSRLPPPCSSFLLNWTNSPNNLRWPSDDIPTPVSDTSIRSSPTASPILPTIHYNYKKLKIQVLSTLAVGFISSWFTNSLQLLLTVTCWPFGVNLNCNSKN